VLGLVLSVWIVESVTCEGEGWYWHVAEGGWELEGEERVEVRIGEEGRERTTSNYSHFPALASLQIAQGGVGGIMSRGGVFNISSICLYPVSFLSSEAAEEGVGEEGEEFTNVLYWGYYRTNFIEVYEKLCNKPLIEVEPLSVGPRIAMHAVLVFICGALLMLTNPTNPTTVTGLMGWLQGGCKEVFWRVFLAFATGDRYTKAVSGRARNQKTHPEARGLKTESGDTSVMEKSDLDTSVTNQENGMGQAFTREEKDDEKGGEMGETETQRKIVVETPKTTICYSLQLLLKVRGGEERSNERAKELSDNLFLHSAYLTTFYSSLRSSPRSSLHSSHAVFGSRVYQQEVHSNRELFPNKAFGMFLNALCVLGFRRQRKQPHWCPLNVQIDEGPHQHGYRRSHAGRSLHRHRERSRDAHSKLHMGHE